MIISDLSALACPIRYPLCHSSEALAALPDGSTVVGVVGASHIDGIVECWDRTAALPPPTASGASTSGGGSGRDKEAVWGDGPSGPEIGARRALLERALVIRGAADVAEMVDELLGPVPAGGEESYEVRCWLSS